MEESLESRLNPYLTLVNAHLESLVPPQSGPTARLVEAMRYSLLSPGKRLRPILCMLSAEAVGGERTVVVNPGCAIEMLHCFSLIHDDLPAIDNDDLRRGRPTLHKAFDEMTAILAADAIFALAFEVLADPSARPEAAARAVYVLAKSVGRNGLVGGEFADVILEGSEVKPENVEFIHPRKTGQLFAAACEIGGLFGGGIPAQLDALSGYGRELGLAFQIADDILNETSTVEVLGKAVGSDREIGKQTYPTAYGMDRSRILAQEAVEKARESLKKGGIESDLLEQLADYSLSRKK